jgi:hypothetical protein
MEGEPSLDGATAWAWADWRQLGGVWLSADRLQVGAEDPRRIHFPVLDVPATIDSRLFESIELALPGPGSD